MKQPDLYNWNGDGGGYQYRWVNDQKKIVCEYQPKNHSLNIRYLESDSKLVSLEEQLTIESKPSVFIMRITTERVIGREELT